MSNKSPLYLKRKHGTPRQIGQAFPVGQKQKLPQRISIDTKRMPTKSDIIEWSKKLDLVPKNVKYNPPTIYKEGSIDFDLGKRHLHSKIVLAEKERNIGQWGKDKNTVYLDSHTPIRDVILLSCHETCEKFFDQQMHIPWNPVGHRLSTICEYNLSQQREPESEWDRYNKAVETIARENKTEGSKLGISLMAANSALSTYSKHV
jgi:hypothetical protein